MNSESKYRDAAEAIEGIVKAVPVYQDIVQPAAQEVGKALQTVAQTIHVALAPISALVWGYDQIKIFVSIKVAEKMKDVPQVNIATPKPNIAGPILESLRYIGNEKDLSDMFANLLAAAMDTRTARGAHPAFIEIIRQLTPDEAKIVRLLVNEKPFPLIDVRWDFKNQTETKKGGKVALVNFSLLGIEAGCEYPDLTPTYINNLCRLGLCDIPPFITYTATQTYEPLENYPTVIEVKNTLEANEELRVSFNRKALMVTPMGKQFCDICAISHEKKNFI